MTGPTDEELMERFANGEDSAFEPLFERHARHVHGFLMRMVRDPRLADDLVQTTFLSVVRARGRYEPGTRFSPWLLTIAGNAGRDFLRRKRHVEGLTPTGELGDAAQVSPAQGDPGLRNRLEAAFATLPVDQREAVVLAKVEGWSFEEISRALGITSTAARLRAHRGYEKLRALLSDLEEA